MEGWTEDGVEGKGKRVICNAGLKYMAHGDLSFKALTAGARPFRKVMETSTRAVTPNDTHSHTHKHKRAHTYRGRPPASEPK